VGVHGGRTDRFVEPGLGGAFVLSFRFDQTHDADKERAMTRDGVWG
jgi:hypothetical protein